eukprot:UN09064
MFIHSLFSHYGNVAAFDIQRDQNGTFLGCGFAKYDDVRSVKLCYEGLNKANIHGKELYD